MTTRTHSKKRKQEAPPKRNKTSPFAFLFQTDASRSVRNDNSSTQAQTRTKKANRKRAAAAGRAGRLAPIVLIRRALRWIPGSPRPLFALPVAAVVLGSVAWLVVQGVHGRASRSESFRIDSVRVEGLVRATEDEIEALAGVELGENLIAIDTDAVEGSVAQHPWVRRVEVRRSLPKELVIEIQEHEPVALVALGHLYYVNSRGEIVKRRGSEERELLPIVTGFEREDIEKGDTHRLQQLAEVIGFLETSRAVLGERAPVIAELHYDTARGLSFVSEGDDVRIHVGQPPWEPQLRRFARVRAALREKGLEATEITLGGVRRPERVVARLEGSERRTLARPAQGD